MAFHVNVRDLIGILTGITHTAYQIEKCTIVRNERKNLINNLTVINLSPTT